MASTIYKRMLGTVEPILDGHPFGQGKIVLNEGWSSERGHFCYLPSLFWASLVVRDEDMIPQDTGRPEEVPLYIIVNG